MNRGAYVHGHPHERGKNLERLQRDTRQPRRNVRVTVTDKLGNGYRSELIPSRFFPDNRPIVARPPLSFSSGKWDTGEEDKGFVILEI